MLLLDPGLKIAGVTNKGQCLNTFVEAKNLESLRHSRVLRSEIHVFAFFFGLKDCDLIEHSGDRRDIQE